MLPLDTDRKPFRHWSGRTQVAKALQQWVNDEKPVHLSGEEAYALAGLVLEAYLKELL
jgi:hypothetical protein